jgi:hypothetical protein
VAALADGGLVEVVGEERVRGAVERTYRLHPSRTSMTDDEVAAMSIDDHHRGFAAAIAALLGEFDAYLAGEGANPRADMVSYKQFSPWLNDEKAAFIEELVVAIRRRMKHTPAPNRRRHMLSILFPTDTP